DGVYLAEGPWPAKAYFDALRQARKRDASVYMDYGYTRPSVLSRGPILQNANDAGEMFEEVEGQLVPMNQLGPETIPTPKLAPESVPAEPTAPRPTRSVRKPETTAARGPLLQSPKAGQGQPAAARPVAQ